MARCLSPLRFRLTVSVLVALLLALTGSRILAIDDNLTKGATNNHVFESGIWGEHIDTLNGGLNLTIPLGPAYGVSADLSYQLKLSYSSKIWNRNTLNMNRAQRSRLSGRGQAGLGFTLQMGRYYTHLDAADCPTYTNVFEDQSGAAHPELGTYGSTDGSLLKVWSTGVKLPDGTSMTLGHQVVDRLDENGQSKPACHTTNPANL